MAYQILSEVKLPSSLGTGPVNSGFPVIVLHNEGNLLSNQLIQTIFECVWLRVDFKNGCQKDMFTREWNIRSKFVNHFRFNREHIWRDRCGKEFSLWWWIRYLYELKILWGKWLWTHLDLLFVLQSLCCSTAFQKWVQSKKCLFKACLYLVPILGKVVRGCIMLINIDNYLTICILLAWNWQMKDQVLDDTYNVTREVSFPISGGNVPLILELIWSLAHTLSPWSVHSPSHKWSSIKCNLQLAQITTLEMIGIEQHISHHHALVN